jgi:hypothetical protein
MPSGTSKQNEKGSKMQENLNPAPFSKQEPQGGFAETSGINQASTSPAPTSVPLPMPAGTKTAKPINSIQGWVIAGLLAVLVVVNVVSLVMGAMTPSFSGGGYFGGGMPGMSQTLPDGSTFTMPGSGSSSDSGSTSSSSYSSDARGSDRDIV